MYAMMNTRQLAYWLFNLQHITDDDCPESDSDHVDGGVERWQQHFENRLHNYQGEVVGNT